MVPLELPEGGNVRQVTLLTPDGGDILKVPGTNEQGRTRRIPHLDA